MERPGAEVVPASRDALEGSEADALPVLCFLQLDVAVGGQCLASEENAWLDVAAIVAVDLVVAAYCVKTNR